MSPRSRNSPRLPRVEKGASMGVPRGPLSFEVPASSAAFPVVNVQAGESWRFRARGRWRDAWIPCGPKGYRNFIADVLGIRPRIEDLPWFCLVGALAAPDGTTIDEFGIGRDADHTFKAAGQVVVFANDLEDRYGNNFGSVTLQLEKVEAEPSASMAPSQAGSRRKATELIGDVVELFAGYWKQALEALDRTAGVLFAFVLTLLAGCALAFMPQGVDLVRAVAEGHGLNWRMLTFIVTLVFLGIQAWFWPRMIIESNYGRRREAWRPLWLLKWTPRLLGVLPFVFALIALARGPAPSTVMLVLLVLFGLGLFGFLVARTRLFGKDDSRWRLLGPAWAALSFVLAVVAMAGFIIWPVRLAVLLGGPAVVFLAFGLFIPPTLTLIQLSRGFRLPIFGAILVVAVVASAWLDDHRVGARPPWVSEVQTADEPISLDQAYAIWRRQAPRAADGTLPIVLVASEGGASRAGYWTGEVMSALRAAFGPGFGKSVFAISSVSGGSVGAVGYVAAQKETPGAGALQLENRVSGFTGADALSPALGGMLFPDLFQRFVPVPFLPDRAQALERGWEAAWARNCPDGCSKNLIARPFQALWDGMGGEQPWLPLVIVDGAGEESGRPILTSKLRFGPGVVDADDFYAINKRDIPASSAIHNGARFPWISPAGRMPSPGGHIVDGGYFEGSGLETVRQMALAIGQTAKHLAVDDNSAKPDDLRFIVIFIGYVPPRPPASKTFLNDIIAPFRAIFNARAAAGPHMVTSLVKDFDPEPTSNAYGIARAGPRSVLQGVYAPILLRDAQEDDGGQLSPPLDWALSQRVQKYMSAYIGFVRSGGADHATSFDVSRLSKENKCAFAAIASLAPGPNSAAVAKLATAQDCPG